MVHPTLRRAAATPFRASYGTYKSPYGPSYTTPPHIKGLSIKKGIRYGAISAYFGATAGLFAVFFFGDIPRVREDILANVPMVGGLFEKPAIPPEDNPF